MSLVPTVATEPDSDDGGGSDDDVSGDESSQQEDRRQDQWPAAECYPGEIGGGNGRGGRSVEAEEDEDGGRRGGGGGGSQSVIGQYVEISSDEEIDRGAIERASGGGGHTLEDVEGGFQKRAASNGVVDVRGEIERGQEEGEREGEGAVLVEGGGGSQPSRKLRLRLPSKGDVLIYGGFLLNVSTKGTISCFETIGAQYAMTNFSLSSAEVRAGRRGVLR